MADLSKCMLLSHLAGGSTECGRGWETDSRTQLMEKGAEIGTQTPLGTCFFHGIAAMFGHTFLSASVWHLFLNHEGFIAVHLVLSLAI